MPLEVESVVDGRTATLKLRGKLLVKESRDLATLLSSFAKENVDRVRLDLHGVKRVDSFALGMLIDLHQQLGSRDIRISIVGPNDLIKELFWDCCLLELFDIQNE